MQMGGMLRTETRGVAYDLPCRYFSLMCELWIEALKAAKYQSSGSSKKALSLHPEGTFPPEVQSGPTPASPSALL